MDKTHDEIKKGLECCASFLFDCPQCSYYEVGYGDCVDEVKRDALAYIRQLEERLSLMSQLREAAEGAVNQLETENQKLQAERDAAVADVKSLCATNYFSGNFCAYCKHNEPDGQCYHPCEPYSKKWGWEWRGVQKEE